MNNTTNYLLILVVFICLSSISMRQQREIDALKKQVADMIEQKQETIERVTDLDFYELATRQKQCQEF